MDQPRDQFEAWVRTQKPNQQYVLLTNISYYQVWLSRQPEIDALKSRVNSGEEHF